MKVLYESLSSDITELCNQYDAVLSSILDKHVALHMTISLWPLGHWEQKTMCLPYI